MQECLEERLCSDGTTKPGSWEENDTFLASRRLGASGVKLERLLCCDVIDVRDSTGDVFRRRRGSDGILSQKMK